MTVGLLRVDDADVGAHRTHRETLSGERAVDPRHAGAMLRIAEVKDADAEGDVEPDDDRLTAS